MDVDLGSALMDVFGAAPAGSTTTTGTVAPGGPPASVPAEASQARDLYAKALAAAQSGDWSAYGTYIKQLGALLDKLATPSKTTTATK